MAPLEISESSIPLLTGKVAVITGGASGIGYAVAKILGERGAIVHLLDRNPPNEQHPISSDSIHSIQCDVTSWHHLSRSFSHIGHVDMTFANAGISEDERFLDDTFDSEGVLLEPKYLVVDVVLKAVLNTIKLSYRAMHTQVEGGSIVLTSSATAYAPESALPIYSALKLGLVGLVRSMRMTLLQSGITINAVAPSCTVTPLLPRTFLDPIKAQGLPTSIATFVALALVYSAFAREPRRVEAYGNESEDENTSDRRWNGRVILTLGKTYIEMEEPIADARVSFFGTDNWTLVRRQQAATDTRNTLA